MIGKDCLSHRMRRECHVLTVVGLTLLSGCSNLDFQPGPIQRVTDKVSKGQPFVEDPVTNAMDVARSHRLEQVLAEWTRVGSLKTDYRIGFHDVLEISVLALEEPGKISVLPREVPETGTVALPMIGDVTVVGKTVTEIGTMVTAAYQDKYILNPQVAVKVGEHRSAAVIVTGAVGQPGIYYLKRNVSSALEVLFMAGGLSTAAGDELVILRGEKPAGVNGSELSGSLTSAPSPMLSEMVRLDAQMAGGMSARTNQVDEEAAGDVLSPMPVDADSEGLGKRVEQRLLTVDLRELIDRGDPNLNLPVFSGDVLSVAPRKATYVNIFGYVRGPGRIPVSKPNEVSALNALAMVGGPTSQGRVENSYLIRPTPQGNKMVKVDLAQIARGIRPDFFLQPGDTLVVGSGVLMKIMEVFRVGGSATYNVAPVP
jgi:polysaccharide export outer membrane protein